jgi:S-formylglutathione hydrolase FrmB
MLDWSLLSGPIPVVLRVSAVVAAIWLLSRTLRARRQLWVKWVDLTGCLLVAAVVTAVVAHLARNVWMLYPDNLAPAVYLWAGAGVFAVNLTVTRVVTERKVGRALVGLTAAVVVVGACANQVNTIYGAYVTPRDALHMVHPDDIALRDAPSHRQLPDADPVEFHWSPPPGLTSQGKLTSAPIAAPQSGFTAREARIYLPPAYFADPQPQLPVMVLLAGQPGTPQDWLTAGKLVHIMDRFAADHRGLAPVVVVPDATGSQFGDPLCLDSRRGNADTYLAKDVPAWVKTHLSVDPDPQSWAIAGVSYGGTCALQLATNHPDVYPTFLDISGSAEPSLGDRPRTVADAFGGDQAAFMRVNPLDLLRTRRYWGSAAAIVVGAGDRDTKSDAHVVYAATRAAGMTSHYIELPGSHDWRLFSAALTHELPWLAQRIGLTQQTPGANG